MTTTVNSIRTAQRSFSIKAWMSEKSEAFSVFCGETVTNKKNLCKILPLQNLSLSLQRQNHKSGTDAASSRWQFLYSHTLANNTTAPCRVMVTSRKLRFYELRQHVAQFLFCLNHKVMETTINSIRTAQRSFSIKAWMSEKSEAFSTFCGETVTNREVVMAHAAVVLLLVACSVAEWLGGGAL